jgi:hypothetical protein
MAQSLPIRPNRIESNDPDRDQLEDVDAADQRADQARAAEGSPARMERARNDEHAFGTSYLGDGKSDEPWQRWRQIQANFVDDPQSSVADAHGLVGELIDGIVRRFETERQQLEQRWSSGEDVSTEELRRCLQRYRDFFGRLLANMGDPKN